MDELLTRFWSDLHGRPNGPFGFRFLFQPAMAVFFAAKAGIRDSIAGKPPYLYGYWSYSEQRSELLRSAWVDLTRMIRLGITLDVLFQVIVFRRVYIGEVLAIVFFLVVLPYAIVRGPVNRMATWWRARHKTAYPCL